MTRKLTGALLALALAISPASAQMIAGGQWTVSGAYQPIDGSAQFGLAVTTNTTLTVPAGARVLQICVEGASVRYSDDASNAPTSSSGMPAAAGTCFPYAGAPTKLKFTAQSGSPTLDVLYYK